MDYTLELYRQMFACLKRGNTKGVFSNAKPIFLVTLIASPSIVLNNKLYWKNKGFEFSYQDNFTKLDSGKITPLWKPFYYLSSEPFYTLVWKASPPEKLLKYPSGRLLRDYLDYAKLDNELWELLQYAGNRQYLRESIINRYLTL